MKGQPSSSKLGLLRRPRRRVTMGTFFGVITVVLFVSYNTGFLSGKHASASSTVSSSKEKEMIVRLEKEKNDLQIELAQAHQNYQIQVEAQKSLSIFLKELEQKNTELMKDIALYQSLFGQNRSLTQGLEIKSFQIFSSEKPNRFRYLLILSKETKLQKFVQGTLSMTIQGKIGDKSINLPVKYIESDENTLGFRFRHLQELAGELTLPEKFEPEMVQCQVIPEGDWPQFQRHFSWVTEASIGK